MAGPLPYECERCERPMDGLARIISEQTPYPGHCPDCAALLTEASHLAADDERRARLRNPPDRGRT